MHYPDLTPYTYSQWELWSPLDRNSAALLNIGWLDAEHPFPKGAVAPEALEKIALLCMSQWVNATRGYYISPFSEERAWGYPLHVAGQSKLLGSAEIRVRGAEGIAYAAPNLIYHYIKDVGYQPPEEFVRAVCDTAV